MSNVERLRDLLGRAVEAPDAYFAALDPDVVWDLRDTASPEAGLYRGREAVRDFYRRWAGAFSDWNFEIERLFDAGDRVVAFVTEHGHGRGSGVQVEMKRANVTTFRDGEIVHFRTFSRRDDALEFAGLSRQELLERAFARWNEYDVEGALEAAADHIEWYPGDVFPDFEHVYVGRQAVARFFDDFMEVWRWIAVEALEQRARRGAAGQGALPGRGARGDGSRHRAWAALRVQRRPGDLVPGLSVVRRGTRGRGRRLESTQSRAD